MIEVTFRLSAVELRQAVQALLGLTCPGDAERTGKVQSGENPAFRQDVFERMQGAPEKAEATLAAKKAENWPVSSAASAENEAPLTPVRRVEAAVGSRLSAPEPASYAIELPGGQPSPWRDSERGEMPAELDGVLTPVSLAKRWERDSRRYDGGFPLY